MHSSFLLHLVYIKLMLNVSLKIYAYLVQVLTHIGINMINAKRNLYLFQIVCVLFRPPFQVNKFKYCLILCSRAVSDGKFKTLNSSLPKIEAFTYGITLHGDPKMKTLKCAH